MKIVPLKNSEVLIGVVCFACHNIGTFKQIPRFWDNDSIIEFHDGHYFCIECGIRHYIEPVKPKEYA